MKKLFLFAVCCSLLFSLYAQRPGMDQKQMVERVKKELSLSDEQVEKWEAIHEKYGEDLGAARKSRNREQQKELRNKMDGELEGILDDAQLTKFQEMKEKRKAAMPRR